MAAPLDPARIKVDSILFLYKLGVAKICRTARVAVPLDPRGAGYDNAVLG